MSIRPVTTAESDMTKGQAAKLQLKWKLRNPSLSCAHLHQELGHSEDGYATATYYCLTCGQAFDRPYSWEATPKDVT